MATKKTTKASVLVLEKKIEALKVRHTQAVQELQCACSHKHVAECPYVSNEYLSSLPPMKICMDCFMTEDGWGPSYQVLRDIPTSITREELYRMRRGLHVRDEMKGPLIRKEITVEELIRRSA